MGMWDSTRYSSDTSREFLLTSLCPCLPVVVVLAGWVLCDAAGMVGAAWQVNRDGEGGLCSNFRATLAFQQIKVRKSVEIRHSGIAGSREKRR
jgi:hypothetical protein